MPMATPVNLIDGIPLWVDKYGHVFNMQGQRVDAFGRPTKPRGAPGRGAQARWRARQGGGNDAATGGGR